MKQIIGLLTGILIVALIALGIYYFTTKPSCNPEPAATEYGIEINGIVYGNGKAAALQAGANELELVSPSGGGGAVKLEIHCNPDADFGFKADGKAMRFAALDNVTAAFELTNGGNGGLILSIEEDLTMTKILAKLFPANEITNVPEDADALDGIYFYLLADFGGENAVKVYLMFGENTLNITLDHDRIIF